MKTETIRVLEHKIDVSFEDPKLWASDGMGRCYLQDCSIAINKNMADDAIASTFMHELTHMIDMLYTLDLSESAIDAIGIGMLSFIRNNPKFIKNNIVRCK